MNKREFSNLLAYDAWANDQVAQSIKTLYAEHRTVRSLFSHISNAHEIWLARVGSQPSKREVWEPYETWSEARDAARVSIAQWMNWLDEMDAAELDRSVTYQNSKGDAFSNQIRHILLHLVNHGTHHRAQLARIVKEAGGMPAVTDFIFYMRNGNYASE